jgi:hypothetical protein
MVRHMPTPGIILRANDTEMASGLYTRFFLRLYCMSKFMYNVRERNANDEQWTDAEKAKKVET